MHLSILSYYASMHCWKEAQLAGAVEYTNCIPTEGKTTPKECPDNDTKQSDCEASVILNIWGMRSTPLLPLLPGPL